MNDESVNPFSNLEFHRSGIGLLPNRHEPDPGLAVHLAKVAGSQRPLTFCSCAAGRRNNCAHLRELARQIRTFHVHAGGKAWGEIFRSGRWYRLAQLLFDGEPQGFREMRVVQDAGTLRLVSPAGVELLRYVDQSPATVRFLERVGKTPKSGGFADRAGLLDRLGTFLRSPEEQHLNKAGMRTNRQTFEQSQWLRLAYHLVREYGEGGALELLVELRTGQPWIRFTFQDVPIVDLAVPRPVLRAILSLLDRDGWGPPPVAIAAVTLFAIVPTTRVSGAEREAVDYLVAYGEDVLYDGPERERYRYGSLAYLPEIEALIDIETSSKRVGSDPEAVDFRPARVCSFRTEPVPEGAGNELVFEDPIAELGIFTEFDSMELVPDESAGSRLSLSIRYRFGDDEVTLYELLRAKKSGQPYYQTASGWIDLNAPALRGLASLLRRKDLAEAVLADSPNDCHVELSSGELLRLSASAAKPIHVEGSSERADFLQRFLQLRPAEALVLPTGLKSELRHYQKLGVEWLKFLYDNRLGGLLCDDMGLGKTHQAMALMVLIREQLGITAPFLVVSPRTVISHWRNKLRDHAPVLRAVQHHGPQRDLSQALSEGDVLLTSYGVLRNDIEKLKAFEWGLVVFDEVQQIKNRQTQGYQAAAAIKSWIKIGLTGTPIENSLSELKGLFDLVLPGYLGSEDDFRDRYSGADDGAASWHLQSLRRLTSPFVLRRVKTAVLDELPPKIEDVRTCTLSGEQLRLYRHTINTKGVALVQKLRTKAEPLPYIHIFALLNMLKQICDHPALALNQIERYREYDSGKWDLFAELLGESLDSGQKVVVFTQYLGMIAIMQRHLDDLGVSYVTLTGSSRKRGDIVDRFNNDPESRVFLGSLKAGGTGIDLVGGSVVIHYDRWWNAAREDQATDRLYRIGQKRVVQVFKLVTEDTLEERIALIIDEKRRLMTSVVQEDDPRLNKIFSPEELIELLRDPEAQ